VAEELVNSLAEKFTVPLQVRQRGSKGNTWGGGGADSESQLH